MREQYGHPIATFDPKASQGIRETIRGALELEEGPLLHVAVSAVVDEGELTLVYGVAVADVHPHVVGVGQIPGELLVERLVIEISGHSSRERFPKVQDSYPSPLWRLLRGFR